MTPIILAGGTGSRLWPMSREALPKQFLSLTGNHSMLQQTINRCTPLTQQPPMVICNEEHRFLVAEQIRQLNSHHSGILLEPVGRNTAPAIALAALHLRQQNKSEELMMVLAADHLVADESAFVASIESGREAATQGKLVTFGIVPTEPHTGYGYIQAGEAINEQTFSIAQFVEKPNVETAQGYVDNGSYYWNSGMFLFRADVFLHELERYRPDIYQASLQAMTGTSSDLDFIRPSVDAFVACPSESIDYAVMESTANGVVVPMDAGWNDIGSWSSLWETSEQKDRQNNVHHGDVVAVGSTGNYVNAESRLVATVGITDCVVVETKDAILVAHKEHVQDIKQVVAKLKSDERSEYKLHRQVYRPWGSYDSIDNGQRYQVKRIEVRPGEKLSVQMHHHRAEHWIVVSGTAKVQIGDTETLVTENESVFIPVGEVHSLENPGKIMLELIEVQSGTYLGEDDIVRFSDRYGRSKK